MPSDKASACSMSPEEAENVARILRRAREFNKENIRKARDRGDIDATLRIASNEAKVEGMMRERGIDI